MGNLHAYEQVDNKIVQIANGGAGAGVSWCKQQGVLMSSRLIGSLALGLLVLSSGCGKGQMGGEVGNGGEADGGDCEDGEEVPVEPDEVVDSLEFDLATLLDVIEGEHTAPLDWYPEPLFSGQVSVEPAPSETSLALRIEPLVDTGRLLQRSPESQGDGSEDGGLANEQGSAQMCSDRLLVDARVTITSENGALDEETVATFWSSDGIVAHAEIPIEPGASEGSFAVDVSEVGDNARAVQTSLKLSVAFGAVSGTLSGLVETRDDDVAMAGGLTYARFPLDDPCPYGVALPEDAEVRAKAQALLSQHEVFDWTWSGQTDSQELSIVTSLLQVCYEENQYPGEPQLKANVESSVTLADGSIDGTWPLDAFITTDASGEVTSIDVVRNGYMGLGVSPANFAEETGIEHSTSEADLLSFSFGFSVHAAQGEPGGGEFTLLELTTPECLDAASDPDPEQEPEGDEEQGGGSPGCQGIEAEESKNATFVGRGS
jgi:hypothetical protein